MDESLNMVHYEKLRGYRHAMYLVIRKMTLEEGELEAMKELYARCPESVDSKAVGCVAKEVELPVLRWLHTVRPLSVKKFCWSDQTIFKNASIKGLADEVRWVVKVFPNTVRSLGYAAHGGYLDLIKWLMKHTAWDKSTLRNALNGAVAAGHLATAKFLYEYKPSLTLAFGQLQSMESLEMMEWDHEMKLCASSCPVLLCAVRAGHLEMVQWLHKNSPELFTSGTMDIAASCGELEIIQFLHANRQEGCTTSAMDSAAANGYLETVQWLHENRSEGCTTKAMDSAARNGYLDTLKWLHANRSEGCTPVAMKDTKYRGIVWWLNEELGLARSP